MKYSRLFGLFLIGFIGFNYPIISLFDVPEKIIKVPLLLGFLFVSWFVIIACAFFLMEFKEGKRIKS